MNEARRWPLDFESLNPGDVIDTAHLEKLTGERAGTESYRLKLLALRDQIAKELGRRFDRTMVIVEERSCLRILTESERIRHVDRESERASRALRRALKIAIDTDDRELDGDEQIDLQRQIEMRGKQVAAMSRTKRQFLKEQRGRATPRVSDSFKPRLTG